MLSSRSATAVQRNVFAWKDEQRSRIKALPTSLDEALYALEADHEFLNAGGVFTDELINMWIDFKRNQESYAVRNRLHPYEMSLYFDV
jgi:glutamine synthetase